MKKLLALALTLSMSTTAFAGTIGSDSGTQTIDVKAQYSNKVETPIVYDVDIEWGSMNFTYTVSGKKTWNSNTHQYTSTTSDGWIANGNVITVTNHSNTGIKTNFTYTKGDNYESVSGSFSKSSFTLPTAENKTTDNPQLTETTALTLGGTLEETVTNLTKVGTITVKISKE